MYGSLLLCLLFLGLVYIVGFTEAFSVKYEKASAKTVAAATDVAVQSASQNVLALNTAAYDKKLALIANNRVLASSSAGSTATSTKVAHTWPTHAVYPNAGAILPFKRIVAYYGNFYSTKMGVLGEYPPQEMLAKLTAEVANWQAADPATPVMPAIDYIAVTAQGSPGADGEYRLRMPDSQIQEALSLADQVHGIVILDVQVGLSTVQTEVPLLAPYLKLPNVELALDPEFSMKTGAKPGTVIGTMDASDINYSANYLVGLVRDNNLPPKILVIHRFTEAMVTNYKLIRPLPEVEMVLDMDGWGSPAKKLNTYQQFIASEPIQFTGFKLFYKNDIKPPSTRMLTDAELLKLTPQPIFIQYQ